MADNKATQRRSADDLVVGLGDSYTVKNLAATIELAASSADDTITFGRIPSNARLVSASRINNDDLATTGSPTLDLGLFGVDSNITDDDDALNDGIGLNAAGADVQVIKDIANIGAPAWSLVSGQSSDPGGEFIVRGTIKDAATNQTGTVTIDLYYVVD